MILGGFAARCSSGWPGSSLVLAAERSAASARQPPRRRPKRSSGAALEIFILAFLFRLQAFIVSPGSSPVTLFRVDILNIMGPAMVVAGLVWGVCAQPTQRRVACARRGGGDRHGARRSCGRPTGSTRCRSGCSGTSARWATTRRSRCFPGPGSSSPGRAVGVAAGAGRATVRRPRVDAGWLGAGRRRAAWRWASTRPRCPTIYAGLVVLDQLADLLCDPRRAS